MKQAEGTTLDFKEVLQVYHTQYQNTHADTPQRGQGTVYLVNTPLALAPSTTPTPTQAPQPTLNGRDRDSKKKTCICRSPDHRWAKCPHLFEWNRSSDFKVNSAIQKQIDEKRAKSKSVESLIQDIIAKHNKSVLVSLPVSPLEAGKHVLMGCVVNGPTARPLPPTVLLAISLNNVHLALIKSYILNSRATDHVCNN